MHTTGMDLVFQDGGTFVRRSAPSRQTDREIEPGRLQPREMT